MTTSSEPQSALPWYRGIARYQWLIFFLASAGWVFDVYEGQIFNITRKSLFADILGPDRTPAQVKMYGDAFLGIFLVGGTFGGLFFGALADRWGRKPTLALTILLYSVFSGMTYWATSLWQIALLRFIVAAGVGGEWSVAAALVAETFPARARAQASSFFQASSVLGTWIAALVGYLVAEHWRLAYLVGVLPALLLLGVRLGMVEPKRAPASAESAAKAGSIPELLANPRWRKRAILGLLLAAIGLGTFWGVHIEGQGLAELVFVRGGATEANAADRAKIAYGWIEATGGGIGLMAFGPIAARWGRRRTFIFYHAMAFALVPITCFAPATVWQFLTLLPLFGFFTLGLHAGYAVYFPELFPNHLRATGAGFCFNGGRLVAAPILFFSGWFKGFVGSLPMAVSILGCMFLLGIVIVLFLPETRGQPLPE